MSWREAKALAKLWASAADAARLGRGHTQAQIDDFADNLRLWVAQQPNGIDLLYVYVSLRVKEALLGFAETCGINSDDLDPTEPEATKPDAKAPDELYPEKL